MDCFILHRRKKILVERERKKTTKLANKWREKKGKQQHFLTFHPTKQKKRSILVITWLLAIFSFQLPTSFSPFLSWKYRINIVEHTQKLTFI